MTTETKPPLASEQGHFYDRKTGAAVYEVAMTSKAGMRPTNIGDARKLDLAPSVTKVMNDCMAKPGLEAWKLQKVLEASLTLPKLPGETVDAYAKRVIEDSKAEGIAAAQRGTDLHKAIEDFIRGKMTEEWRPHLEKLTVVFLQLGIDLFAGQPEHSFAASLNELWYGGKIDFHLRDSIHVLCDFKSKDKIEPKKPLVYDEHAMQIGAYGYGLFGLKEFRGLNIFVGVNDCEIRAHEHSIEDLVRGRDMFACILDFWSRKNRFGKYSK